MKRDCAMVFTYRTFLAKRRVSRIKISVKEPPGVNYSTGQPWNCSCIFLAPLYTNRQGLLVFLFLHYWILKLLPWFKKFWCLLCRVSHKTNSSNPEDANNQTSTKEKGCVFSFCERCIFNETVSHLKFEIYSLSIPFYHLPCSGWFIASFCSRYRKGRKQVHQPETLGSLDAYLPSEKTFFP